MASFDTKITIGLDDEGRALLHRLNEFPASELREVLQRFTEGTLATKELVQAIARERDLLAADLPSCPLHGPDLAWLRTLGRHDFAVGASGDVAWDMLSEVLTR